MRHGVADQTHPPQHQEHADRRAAQRQRDDGGQRPAHEFELGEGRDQRVVDHRDQAARDAQIVDGAGRGTLVEGFAHPARFREIFRGQDVGGWAPGHRPARQQQGFRKMGAHQIHVVQRRQHRALFSVPAPHQRQQIGRGPGVDGVEGLVQHDQARVLQQHPCKQHALHLPAGQRADGAVLETVEADG